jgi:hypothetical protein
VKGDLRIVVDLVNFISEQCMQLMVRAEREQESLGSLSVKGKKFGCPKVVLNRTSE